MCANANTPNNSYELIVLFFGLGEGKAQSLRGIDNKFSFVLSLHFTWSPFVGGVLAASFFLFLLLFYFGSRMIFHNFRPDGGDGGS